MKSMGWKQPSYATPEVATDSGSSTQYPSISCYGGPLGEMFRDANIGDTVEMTMKVKVTRLSVSKNKGGDKISVDLDILEAEDNGPEKGEGE